MTVSPLLQAFIEAVELCLLNGILLDDTEFTDDDEEEDEVCFCNLLSSDVRISDANVTDEVEDTEDLWLTEAVTSESASEVFLELDVFNIPVFTEPFLTCPLASFTLLFLLNLFIDSVTDISFLYAGFNPSISV